MATNRLGFPIVLSDSSGASAWVEQGVGDPSGVLARPQGSLLLRRDAPELWQNTDGATSWTLLASLSLPLGGDLSGTLPDPTVVGIQGYPIEGAAPANGDALLYNSTLTRWEHAPIIFGGGPPVGPAGGDLGGIYPNPQVVGLYTSPVSAAAPALNEVLTWDGAAWAPSPVAVTAPLGTIVLQTSPVQMLTASTDQISPTTSYHRLVCAGNVTLTSTPTISWPGAAVGQVVILHNVGPPGAGHLTLNRGAATALSLSNANTRVDEGGSMTLVFDGSAWTETSHTQATST